jgi:hypothetical protein
MPAGAEKAYQDTLVGLLEMFGYVTEHSYPLMTKQGFWRTGSTLKGKPDLIAVRPPRLLAIEVKVPPNRIEPEQRCVLSLYAAIPCARAWLVTPTDPPWADLQQWVRHPRAAPVAYGFEVMDPVEARAELGRLAKGRRASKQSKRG